MDLRKPGEEEDEYSEMAEEAMEPDNCFPDCKYFILQPHYISEANTVLLLHLLNTYNYFSPIFNWLKMP